MQLHVTMTNRPMVNYSNHMQRVWLSVVATVTAYIYYMYIVPCYYSPSSVYMSLLFFISTVGEKKTSQIAT